MILDWHPDTGFYTLAVERKQARLVADLMEAHGLDFSNKRSTPGQAILMTKEPYAAVAFFHHATEAAQHNLAAMQLEIERSWASVGLSHIDVPPDEELWPFQKAGVEYALARRHTLFGDVPGLGKTAQAIAYCNEVKAKRVLVICPANIRLQWVTMIRRWSTMKWPYQVYPILKGSNGTHPTAAWTVVSYDLAGSEATMAALMEGTYDVLILDEAHYLKTVDARRTRSVFGQPKAGSAAPLASRCGSILALSGTPLPNRPREAYTLARGLCFDSVDFMSEDTFRTRFNPSVVNETRKGGVYVDERTGRHSELQSRLRANFMVRREKHGPRGVMSQLQLPLYSVIHIEEDAPIRQALKAERMLDLDPDHMPGPASPLFGQIATVRRMMGEALAPHVGEYVAMCLDGGEDKVVVFGHHISVLDILESRLAKYGVVRIDGRTGAGKKQLLVDRFQREAGNRVCLGNILSLGTGTDGLQNVATHAIFSEVDWTPGNNQQGVDRLDRGGQSGRVQADFLVAPGSLSERVLATAIRKLGVTHSALDKQFNL